jgi:two-component system, OmpR family, heavy metal sensor histidine kinase CusS
MKRLSIRWKLTLWYGGVLAVVLLVFGAAVFFTMRHQFLERIDQGLAEELAEVRYEVKQATDADALLKWLERRFSRHEGIDFQITRPNGDRFFVNQRLIDKSLPIPMMPADSDSPLYESVRMGSSGRWRVVSIRVTGPDGPLLVQVARSLAEYDHESQELLFVFLMTGPLTLLVAVSGGYFLARRALTPVHNITQTAKQITADRLSQRVAVDNPHDELGSLAQTLNEMIERLESSFTEMQRFTADAAHELRTPLAVIRNEAEVALRLPRSSDEYCRVLENLLEETNRLSEMADQLLFLCRQDAGLLHTASEIVAVDDLLREVVGNMQLVAEEKGVSLSLNENPSCQLLADRRQLRRVFYNLLDNAIKYTGASGQVTVSSNTTDGRLSVMIADSGVGIPQEHLPRVFDRFYRVDPSRTGDGSGAGLGLSICQSIVKALGGSIRLESSAGQGTKVRVVLPIRRT